MMVYHYMDVPDMKTDVKIIVCAYSTCEAFELPSMYNKYVLRSHQYLLYILYYRTMKLLLK